jgi:hypothetical protein
VNTVLLCAEKALELLNHKLKENSLIGREVQARAMLLFTILSAENTQMCVTQVDGAGTHKLKVSLCHHIAVLQHTEQVYANTVKCL